MTGAPPSSLAVSWLWSSLQGRRETQRSAAGMEEGKQDKRRRGKGGERCEKGPKGRVGVGKGRWMGMVAVGGAAMTAAAVRWQGQGGTFGEEV